MFLNRLANNEVGYGGIDKGSKGVIIAENDKTIVVKWSAGTHFVGNYMKPAYHSPSTDVLLKGQGNEVTLLISWDNKRK